MNGDVEISNIVFDNCNVEDKGNTVVQDYSSGAAVVSAKPEETANLIM